MIIAQDSGFRIQEVREFSFPLTSESRILTPVSRSETNA